MASVTATRPASKPITSPDPWTDPPVYDVDKAALVFGVRVRHHVLPGEWKVVRAAQRYDSTRRHTVRVREYADNGSLIGPVLSWTLDEVAGLVTDEPAPAEVEPAPPVADEPRPLIVAMAISIDGTHYAVAPLAPAPGAVRAYRFSKVGGDEAVYDLDETVSGASCSCPDFVWRREGLDTAGCKHIRAARMLGLFAEAPEPTDPRDSCNDMREKLATIASAEDAVRREGEARQVEPVPCCPDSEPAPCQACVTFDGPADLSDDGWDDGYRWEMTPDADPDDDPEVRQLIEDGAELEAEGEEPLGYATPECFAAVAEGRAEFSREFGYVPCPGYVTREDAHDLLADEAIGDGWASRRDRAFADAMKARTLSGPPALDVTLGLDLAGQVDDVADAYRANGTAFGAFLANHLGGLSARIRFLGATTVADYDDRLATLMDGVRAEAESRG